MKMQVTIIGVCLSLLVVTSFTSRESDIEKLKTEMYKKGFEAGKDFYVNGLLTKNDIEAKMFHYTGQGHVHDQGILEISAMPGAKNFSFSLPFINTNEISVQFAGQVNENHKHVNYKLIDINLVDKNGEIIGKQVVAYDLEFEQE